MEVAASILNADENEMTQTLYNLESAGVDLIHIDVMDGEYVERNTSALMQKYADCAKNIITTPLDIHLMCKDVKTYVDIFSPNNPNMFSFHIEVMKDENEVKQTIEYIKDAHAKVGIVVDADTDVESVFQYLPYIHYCLVMSVKAGKGGQKFIEDTYEKISKLKKYIEANNLETEIEVDGGVTADNISKLKDAGVDIAVVGSYLINSKDYKYTMEKLKNV